MKAKKRRNVQVAGFGMLIYLHKLFGIYISYVFNSMKNIFFVNQIEFSLLII